MTTSIHFLLLREFNYFNDKLHYENENLNNSQYIY